MKNYDALHNYTAKNLIKIMRLSFMFFFISITPAISAYSQTDLTIKLENVEVEEVIFEIMNQSDYDFFYGANLFKGLPKVTVNFEKVFLDKLLNQVVRF